MRNLLTPCICICLVLILSMFIVGPILWVTECNHSNDSRCNFNTTTCELTNYQIDATHCESVDDDADFQCYQLILDCAYSNKQDICMAPYKYFNSYQYAEEYYQNNFYINQTLNIYFDGAGNCSYFGPSIRPYEQTIGLVFLIFGAVFVFVLLCACVQQRRTINRNYIEINDELPKYVQSPPPYHTLG